MDKQLAAMKLTTAITNEKLQRVTNSPLFTQFRAKLAAFEAAVTK